MRRICIVLALLVACGDDGGGTQDDAPPADDAPLPPDGPAPAISRTLYLAFDGGMVMPGNDDATANTSTLATMSATLPPYLQNDPQRATKLADIAAQISMILAPYNIEIVMARPTTGTYHMILFTSAAPSAIGSSSGGSALVAATCNQTAAVIGFVFGRGVELPRDVAVRNAIAMFGLFGGVPLSVTGGDCMCLIGTSCANVPQPCTIGGPGTMVTTGPGSCGFTGTVDEVALFTARFGQR
jgi:hypothetical protein